MAKKQLDFNSLSKQEKLKIRKEAYRTWALSQGTAVNKHQSYQAAASRTGLTVEQVKKLSEKDKWDTRYDMDIGKGTFKKEIKHEKEKAMENLPSKEELVESIDELLSRSGLSDRHKLFICYYLQNFNAVQAAMNAGYSKHSANNEANRIMKNPKVRHILSKATELMQKDIYFDAKMLIEEYMRVAFADITDYLEFDGRRVKLKDSTKVDGRLITEVRQGKDGITIKLIDKKWAMDKLEKLINLLPDKRLELDIAKFEYTKQLADKETIAGSKVVIINDL
jgi:phage terminase small subunit